MAMTRLPPYIIALCILSTAFACSVEQIDGPLGIARKGDPCAVEGSVACTKDFTTELRCTGGEFLVYQQCEGGCELVGDPPDVLLECLSLQGNPKP